MKQINSIDLFNRNEEKKQLINFINNFDIKNNSQSKGIYILGPVGCGKTHFVNSIINELDYDIVSYDAGNSRTKSTISDIMGSKLSNYNVMNMFYKKKRKIVIIMDEMDYMNIGDKGGIKEMIKYTRAKKTKKQQTEPQTVTPIIYIGCQDNDKKIKEIVNVCNVIRLKKPTESMMLNFILKKLPVLETFDNSEIILRKLLNYTNFNLHKINVFEEFFEKTKDTSKLELMINSVTNKFNQNMYTKSIVKELYTRYIPILEYNDIVKETDRTTLGLLWHENLPEVLSKTNYDFKIKLYNTILTNLCVSDYNDRIIFQNQIWQLSEQNSFNKTLFNNYLLHNNIKNIKIPNEIIFTKVLTKYSTEYNNFLFLQQLEQKIFLDKKNILHMFLSKSEEDFSEDFYLTSLDIDRINRFLKNGEFTCGDV